ncbi:MAG: hypothetical protein KDA37_12760 [Planctomycetales bacterium]|nr:hypothetical protein [Planctomycetales bacterium]
MCEHDPFNEPETAHARARELMKEEFFWDCVDEWAPFGSDEGNDAYHEWRSWRSENPAANLLDCLDWILVGRSNEYDERLLDEATIQRDAANPDSTFLAEHYDVFTLDTTVIATALGQLMDEGRIDHEAKPYVKTAIARQSRPEFGGNGERLEYLTAIARVIDEA